MKTLSSEKRAALASGKVFVTDESLSGDSAPKVLVQAVIDREPAVVWKDIDQVSRYAEFMPRVKKSVELSRDGDIVRTQMTLKMPFPLKDMSSVTTAVHSVQEGERYERRWTLESGDYHTNEGYWLLLPFDGDPKRCYVEYEVAVRPKIPIPKALQKIAQEKSLPGLIDSMRKRAKR